MATETAVEVVMPQMGVSVSEGTITKWLKAEGEQVEADEALLELSTDKAETQVRRAGGGGGAPARDLDRQGRHRSAEPRLGDADADPRAGGRDRRRGHEDRR